jgi:hypothetical protein
MIEVEVGTTGIMVSTTDEGGTLAMEGGADVGRLQAKIDSARDKENIQ